MKDHLAWNKIFGAILGTALVILGLTITAQIIYAPHKAAKMGDAIVVAADTSDAGPAVADTPPDWGTVLPVADVAAGLQVSTKCASCHSFNEGGANGTGPNNWGVIGRQPGSKPGFAYSSAMQDFGKKVAKWDYDHLYLFLAGPQNYINGTKMSFVGLKKPEDRINLIAWLRQQSSSPAPIPAPNPAAAAPSAAAKVADTGENATSPVSADAGNATGTAGQTASGAAAPAKP